MNQKKQPTKKPTKKKRQPRGIRIGRLIHDRRNPAKHGEVIAIGDKFIKVRYMGPPKGIKGKCPRFVKIAKHNAVVSTSISKSGQREAMQKRIAEELRRQKEKGLA